MNKLKDVVKNDFIDLIFLTILLLSFHQYFISLDKDIYIQNNFIVFMLFKNKFYISTVGLSMQQIGNYFKIIKLFKRTILSIFYLLISSLILYITNKNTNKNKNIDIDIYKINNDL